MAKSSHVPKFGNWDNDNNVPYTDYFENARKQKPGVRMNPNDPEENPEAFMACNTRRANNIAQSHINYSHMNKEINLKHRGDHGHRHDLQGHQRIDSAHQNSISSYKSNTSESVSDEKSSPDYSLLQNRRARVSQRKKSNSLAQGHTRHTSGTSNIVNHSSSTNDAHHRATSSVPKFGAWDEADPKSGEGFTAIFEKVKEEKQIASTNFPAAVAAPPQPCNYINARTKRGRSSFKSPKMCCCLFSKESE